MQNTIKLTDIRRMLDNLGINLTASNLRALKKSKNLDSPNLGSENSGEKINSPKRATATDGGFEKATAKNFVNFEISWKSYVVIIMIILFTKTQFQHLQHYYYVC